MLDGIISLFVISSYRDIPVLISLFFKETPFQDTNAYIEYYDRKSRNKMFSITLTNGRHVDLQLYIYDCMM